MDASPARTRVAGRTRVLIVDDDALFLRALCRFLDRRSESYAITAASGARDALQKLEQAPVDAIVCDVTMGSTSGCDLHARIAARWPGLERRMAFVTGGCALVDRDYLCAAGNPVLEKPPDLETLEAALRKVGCRAGGDRGGDVRAGSEES